MCFVNLLSWRHLYPGCAGLKSRHDKFLVVFFRLVTQISGLALATTASFQILTHSSVILPFDSVWSKFGRNKTVNVPMLNYE
jgi:hypothetical protein